MRKDQDLTAEAERLDKAIVEAVSREPSKRDSITEQRIRDRLDSVSRERKGLQDVFAWEFPNYAALSKPEPLTAKEIQSLLDADEALVVFDLDQHSYVWVVTKDRADWKEIQIPAAQASKTVETLRAALNPDSPKPYDRALAYQLYQHLFAPVEEIISKKARLSFVLNGALTSLPPQVLVTSDPEEKDLGSTSATTQVTDFETNSVRRSGPVPQLVPQHGTKIVKSDPCSPSISLRSHPHRQLRLSSGGRA